ncbi:MAG: hypothetical protein AB1916_14440 [Thermodesulfobacteriota bacterium]
MSTNDTPPRELDILEMPLEGLAAYWLSLRKLMGDKVNRKVLLRSLPEEAERTSEPFVRHLLDICAAPFDDAQFLTLAGAKRDAVLRDLRLKFDLMRDALLSIASGENPRQLLVTMMTHFSVPPLTEQKATQLAVETVKTAQTAVAENKPEEAAGVLGRVDHRDGADRLLVKLLFLAYWARREGRHSIPAFVMAGGRFFRESLSLVVDGFEPPYVKRRVEFQAGEMIEDARLKMEMATQMALALRRELAYEDLYRVAKSYLL